MLAWLRNRFGFRAVRAELPPRHLVIADWNNVRVVAKVDRPDAREAVKAGIEAWLYDPRRPVLVVPTNVEITLYEAKSDPRLDPAIVPVLNAAGERIGPAREVRGG